MRNVELRMQKIPDFCLLTSAFIPDPSSVLPLPCLICVHQGNLRINSFSRAEARRARRGKQFYLRKAGKQESFTKRTWRLSEEC